MRWIAISVAVLAGRAAAAPSAPCTGKLIDLAAERTKCRVNPAQQTDATDQLKASLVLPASVVSGRAFTFQLVLENRGKKKLELLFVEDQTSVVILDGAGKPLPVRGDPPGSPEDCDRWGDPYVPYWKVILLPGGKAVEALRARADGARWSTYADCDGPHPEPDDLNPLPAGSYRVAAGVSLAGKPLSAFGKLVVTAAPAPGAPGDPCTAKEHDFEQAELPECRMAPGSKPSTGLVVKLVPASATVAKGGKLDLVLEITNTGAAPSSILVHAGALTVSAKDAKGRALTVAGKPVPPEASCLVSMPAHWVAPLFRQTLPPGGVAHGERTWLASKLAYGKKPQACNPSAPEPVAPLPPGRYTVSAQLDGLGSADAVVTVTP